MHTSEKSVYRITGERQIQDIIESGYIRPRPDRPGSTHNGKVYWSHGGEKLFYNGGNPDHYILQAKADLIKNGQIGAPSIDTLEAIWKCLRDVQPGEPWRVDILEEVLAARQAYLQGAAPGETAS